MVNPEISFNSLLFNGLKSEVFYHFSKKKLKDSHPFKPNTLPPTLVERLELSANDEPIFCSFNEHYPTSVPFPIDLKSYPTFAQQALHIQILEYFTQKGYLNTLSFINGVMIYLEDIEKSDNDQKVYNSFELRVTVTHKSITLLVSYSGKKSFSKQTVHQVLKRGVQLSDIAVVANKNRLIKLKDKSQTSQLDWSCCYPKLNRSIRQKLGYSEVSNGKNQYKYATYLNNIEWLLKNELSTEQFLSIFPHSKNWITTPYQESKSVSIIKTSNQLRIFGNNQKDTVISSALAKYGPYNPPSFGNYTFFFIYHKDHLQKRNQMESAISDKLPKLIRLNYSLNPSLDIIYSSYTEPFFEIKEQLEAMNLKPQTTYVAIYLSLTDKVECTDELSANYYKIKELLLQRGIVSQVIHHQKINSNSFNFFIPNIAVSLCAKLGGTPWIDSTALNDELVIGIGAYKSIKSKRQYIGNACAFSNNGLFRGIKAYPSTEINALGGNLAMAVRDFVKEGKKLKRIIIHFYKVMSDKELQPIQDMLSDIDIEIPIIIITINKTESSDYLIFDTSTESKMPLHGTAVNIKDNQWLLCNNERYETNSEVKKGRFPLKLRFNCKDSSQIDRGTIINDYLPQIIQFSKLYWKSVSNKSHPVTMLYSEMVAQFYQHFETPAFSDKYEKTAWFL